MVRIGLNKQKLYETSIDSYPVSNKNSSDQKKQRYNSLDG